MADGMKVLLVCAHYEAGPGEVFVEVYDEDCGQLWERRAATDVGDATIITCARCDKAAVQLDHLWPYHQEMCLCAEHLEVWREEYRQEQRDLKARLRRLPETEKALAERDARVAALEAQLADVRAEYSRGRCFQCRYYDREEERCRRGGSQRMAPDNTCPSWERTEG